MATDKFSEIYAKNYVATVNYITWKFNGDSETAQDVAQDVFVRVLKYLPTFDETKSKITTWIRNITNTVILDYYRMDKEGRNSMPISKIEGDDDFIGNFQIVDDSTKADGLILNNELSEKIKSAFAKLNAKELEIANLFFIEENEYQEIVEKLNVPMGTVKGMINRIRVKLQSEIRAYAVA